MIIIDSSGWLHYFMNGDLAESYARYLTKRFREIVTPSIVLYEVYKKLRKEVDEEMDGSVLTEVFNDDFVKKNPIRKKKYGQREGKGKLFYGQEDQNEVKERLKALGYLD